jgi:16S rRNA processing protein RimM
VRVAFLSDVHGMPTALAAVLDEVKRERVDAIVFGGDIFLGPLPRETLELITPVEAQYVRGNCDREPDGWVRLHLDEETVSRAQEWPVTVTLDGVLYCHATPRSDEPILTDASPDERFAAALDGIEERLVVAGHTHMQFRRGRWVNGGSVGMPYEDDVAAFWALVDGDVEFRRTPFDVERAVREIEESGWPSGAEFIKKNLRASASRKHATEYFEGLAVREELVIVGRVGRAHGLDGSFVVEEASDDPRRFEVGAKVWIDGEQVVVVASKRVGGRPVIRIEHPVECGQEISVRSGDLALPEEGSYYVFQLVGLAVEEEGGRSLGRVREVAPGVANDVLELDSGLSLPLVEDCVREVDLGRGRIVVARGFAEAG